MAADPSSRSGVAGYATKAGLEVWPVHFPLLACLSAESASFTCSMQVAHVAKEESAAVYGLPWAPPTMNYVPLALEWLSETDDCVSNAGATRSASSTIHPPLDGAAMPAAASPGRTPASALSPGHGTACMWLPPGCCVAAGRRHLRASVHAPWVPAKRPMPRPDRGGGPAHSSDGGPAGDHWAAGRRHVAGLGPRSRLCTAYICVQARQTLAFTSFV